MNSFLFFICLLFVFILLFFCVFCYVLFIFIYLYFHLFSYCCVYVFAYLLLFNFVFMNSFFILFSYFSIDGLVFNLIHVHLTYSCSTSVYTCTLTQVVEQPSVRLHSSHECEDVTWPHQTVTTTKPRHKKDKKTLILM